MRAKTNWIKIFLPLVCLVGTLSSLLLLPNGSTIPAVAFNFNSANYSAVGEEDGVILSVEKVLRPYEYSGETKYPVYDAGAQVGYKTIKVANPKYGSEGEPASLVYGYKDVANNNPNLPDNVTKSKTIIRNGSSIMLNDIISSTATEVENIMFTFASYNNTTTNLDGQKVVFINVTAKLNGNKIGINANRIVNEKNRDFTMFMDLNNMVDEQGKIIDKAKQEGLYEFSIEYHVSDQNGVEKSRTVNFSFYILSNLRYTNPITVGAHKYNVAPTFQNVENSIANVNYFNFYKGFTATDGVYNNSKNIDNKGILQYPLLTFDVQKYSVDFTRTYNELVEYYNLKYTSANTATLTKTFLGEAVTKSITLSDNYIVNILFSEVGKYNFTFYARPFDTNSANNVPDYEISVPKAELTILGYQLHYNKDNNGDAYLKKLTVNIDGKTALLMIGNVQSGSVENSAVRTGVVTEVEDAEVTAIMGKDLVDSIEGISPYTLRNNINKGQNIFDYISTNQAPLWLDHLGSNSHIATSRVFYSADVNKEFVGKAYTKDQLFEKVGYYVVKIDFDYEQNGTVDSNAGWNARQQIFAFYINVTTPEITIKTTDKNLLPDEDKESIITKLESGEFTNQNVFVHWKARGTFENVLTARYWYSDKFESDRNKMTLKGQVPSLFTVSGSYIVEINHGVRNSNTYVHFIIDKETIVGIETYAVNKYTDALNKVSYQYRTDVTGAKIRFTDKATVDKFFTLIFKPKALTTKINVAYTFTPFIRGVETAKVVSTADSVMILNNYAMGQTSQLEKLSTNLSTNSAVSKDYVFTAGGIYVFYFNDDAGNTMQYCIILDNTDAAFAQNPAKDMLDPDNIVSVPTTVTWGTHKGVRTVPISNIADFMEVADVFNFVTDGNDGDKMNYPTGANKDSLQKVIKYYDNRYTLSIPIKQVTITSEFFDTTIPATTDTINYPNLTQTNKVINNNSSDEGVYTFTVSTDSNITFANETAFSKYVVEMNLDKAKLRILGYYNEYNEAGGGEITDGDNKTIYNIAQNKSTAPVYVRTRWMEGVGDFEVESVTYQYHPYDLLGANEGNANYPFTKTPEYTEDVTIGDKKDGSILSKPLKLTTEAIFNGTSYETRTVSAAGMYKITRKYVNASAGQNVPGSNDKGIREFVFYIDRYGIISYNSDEKIVGGGINVALGSSEDTTIFDSFQKTAIIKNLEYNYDGVNTLKTNVLFVTNKLPTKVNVPSNKYMKSSIGAFELDAKVYYRSVTNKQADIVAQKLSVKDGYIDLTANNFNRAGYYIVTITDNTVVKDQNRAVSTTFAFEVKNEAPQAYFYGKNKGGIPTSLYGSNSTKDDELSLVISQPADNYSSKVDVGNVTITRTWEGHSTPEVYYSLKRLGNGGYSESGIVTSTSQHIVGTGTAQEKVQTICTVDGANVTSISELIDAMNARKAVKYNLLPKGINYEGFDSPITEPNREYKYTVNIQYFGNSENYVVDGKSFYKNTLHMNIDRTPPKETINSLVAGSAEVLTKYLEKNNLNIGNMFKTDDNTIITNEGTPDEEKETFYSYFSKMFFAFPISTEFTFVNDDLKFCYYRKMDLNSEAKAQKLPSLLPGDKRSTDYTNYPSNYRFNIGNSNVYQMMNPNSGVSFYNQLPTEGKDGYYEIIEMDEAGNTSTYIVLINTASLTINPTFNAVVGNNPETTLPSMSYPTGIGAPSFKLTQINSLDKFVTISLTANKTKIYEQLCDQDTNMSMLIADINKLIVDEKVYVLSISNRFGVAMNFSITIVPEGRKLLPNGKVIVNPVNPLEYLLNTDGVVPAGSALSIASITVYKGDATTGITYTTGLALVKLGSAGWYRVVYVPSVGAAVTQYVYAGEVEQGLFYNTIDGTQETVDYVADANGKIFTTKNAMVKFITNRYNLAKMKVTKNNQVFDPVQMQTGNYTKLLFTAPPIERTSFGAVGALDQYVVELEYVFPIQSANSDAPATQKQTITFEIDTRFPAISFANNMGVDRKNIVTLNKEISNTSTSEDVVISWGSFASLNPGMLHYELRLIKDRDTANPINITSSPNRTFTVARDKVGNYVLEMLIMVNGKVAERRFMAFTIAQTTEKMYSVVNTVTGEEFGAATDFTTLSALDIIMDGKLTEIKNNKIYFVGTDRYTDYSVTQAVDLYYTSYGVGKVNVVGNGDKGIEATLIKSFTHRSNEVVSMVTELYQVKATAESSYSYERLIAITHIAFSVGAPNANKIINYNPDDPTAPNLSETNMKIYRSASLANLGEAKSMTYNSYIEAFVGGSGKYIFADIPTVFNLGLNDSIANGNTIIVEISHNSAGTDKKTIIDMSKTTGRIPFDFAGEYTINIRDKAGNTQVFTNFNGTKFDFYSLTLLTEVAATINGNAIVDNAFYNNSVVFEIFNPSIYTADNTSGTAERQNVAFKFMLNGVDVTDATTRNKYVFTFTKPGTYELNYSAKYNQKLGGSSTIVKLPERRVIFTIVDPFEARLALDFTTLYNGYNIDAVYKLRTNGGLLPVTSDFISLMNDANGCLVTYEDLAAKTSLGAGKYQVNYSVVGRKNLPDVHNSFTFWVNNQTPSIISSIAAGEKTTKNIEIKFNKYVIYQQLGDCVIRITNMPDIIINAETATANAYTTVVLEYNQSYYVQVVGVGDSVISSFKVTKVEPLNTLSIILIIIASILVIGGTVMFILMRTKMKVR